MIIVLVVNAAYNRVEDKLANVDERDTTQHDTMLPLACFRVAAAFLCDAPSSDQFGWLAV